MSRAKPNPGAISESFLKYESFLKRYLSRFFSRRQDIEDVVQDTFLKSFSAAQRGEIASPKAFLFRVARNAALKELSKKSRKITGYIEDIDVSEVSYEEISLEDHILAKEKLGLFCQSALEMTTKCRRVFLMAKVYGLSYKDISAQLDISVSTVEKHVAKGLEICSEYMNRMEHNNSSEIIDRSPSDMRKQGVKMNLHGRIPSAGVDND